MNIKKSILISILKVIIIISGCFLILMALIFLAVVLAFTSDEKYPETQFTITNNLNEEYTVEYAEESGFPDTGGYIKIYDSDIEILEKHGDYKNILPIIPDKIIFLFSDENDKYYYMENNDCSYIFNQQYDINIMDNLSEYKTYADYKEDDEIKYLSEYLTEEYSQISKIMQENTNEIEIKEKFKECDCDYNDIISLYNFISK